LTQAPATIYVYGILRAADASGLKVSGVADATVRTVAKDDLAALVSDLEGDSLAAAREIRAHWSVLEEASSSATVLPVRFGTVMEGEAAVRERLLEPNAGRLTTALEQLQGRVQLTVKGVYDEEALLRDVMRQAPAIDQARRRIQAIPSAAGYYQRIELGEAVAAQVERRREADTGFALARLEPLCVASKAEPVSAPDAAFNLAFLVDREQLDPFSAAVVELGEAYGEALALRYVGPLPPYSFADIDLSTESAAWA
jgi:Gas vesicle synthesis protein GvpL/GvpF